MTRISCTPNPPVAGQPVKICYDFNGSGIGQTNLEVEFTLSPTGSSSSTHTVKVGDHCVTIQVPSNAVAMKVHDTTGTTTDLVTDVVAPPIEEGAGA